MEIRGADSRDCKQLARIHIEAWQSAYGQIMPAEYLASIRYEDRLLLWQKVLSTDSACRYWVAEHAGDVIGFLAAGPVRDDDLDRHREAELIALNVSPKFWGKGAADLLLDTLKSWALDREYQAVYLWVVDENPRARRFYERHGFRNTEKLDESKLTENYCLKEWRYRLPL